MSKAWRRHDRNKVIRPGAGGGLGGLLVPGPYPTFLHPTSVEGQVPPAKLPSPPEDFGPVKSQASCHGDIR